jgi:hypothetical protein
MPEPTCDQVEPLNEMAKEEPCACPTATQWTALLQLMASSEAPDGPDRVSVLHDPADSCSRTGGEDGLPKPALSVTQQSAAAGQETPDTPYPSGPAGSTCVDHEEPSHELATDCAPTDELPPIGTW